MLGLTVSPLRLVSSCLVLPLYGRSRVILIAASMPVMVARSTVPIRCLRRVTLIERICSQTTTESIVRPPFPLATRAWLGYSFFLLAASVIGQTTTTELFLLIASRLTTTTGRVPACSDPSTGDKHALNMSPRLGEDTLRFS